MFSGQKCTDRITSDGGMWSSRPTEISVLVFSRKALVYGFYRKSPGLWFLPEIPGFVVFTGNPRVCGFYQKSLRNRTTADLA